MMEITRTERISSALAAFVARGGAERGLVAALCRLFAAAGEHRDIIQGEVTQEKSIKYCLHIRMLRIRNQLLVFAATNSTVSPQATTALG
ncbi:hypothetical protein RA280_45950 [Cupriavidus sp. CV2]|uniref:hypothetical protein n=1 Tax=Cupriavidus ulmosensis TaxID=3065913 RepID=UPI00296ABFC2|nr:hypothetical protein [Cupriavidus sp. CV2]MDW3688940.1 hypothetical protein [Cupriavidus sp. CV2]